MPFLCNGTKEPDTMDKKKANRLLDDYTEGKATPEARSFMDAWYNRAVDEQPPVDALHDWAGAKATIWQRIAPRASKRVARWPYVAAAAVLALAIGVWIAISQQQSAVSLAASEILPGGNRATLTLADGRVINLDEAQTGITVSDEDISYDDGSSLNVMAGEAEPSLPNPGDALAMLSLTTPRGGTYQITLPDGSKVWLNANSTLKYPSRFLGDSREVFLEGEAFFEIRPQVRNVETHDYASFNVQTANQVVKVLGTQFNLSAYPDEAETRTTLVEGKVTVTSDTQQGSTQTGLTTNGLRLTTKILSPGEQAIMSEAAIRTSQVDVTQYTAWKDGFFNFNGKTLQEAMKQLARWYDIEVDYEGGVPDNVTLRGKMERNLSLQTTLEILQRLNLKYRVEGRRLTIINN